MTELALTGTVEPEHHAVFAHRLASRQFAHHFGSTRLLLSPWTMWIAFALVLGLVGHLAYGAGSSWWHYGHPHLYFGDWVLLGLGTLFLASFARRGRTPNLETVVAKAIGDHCIAGITTGTVAVRASEGGIGVAHDLRETHYAWTSFLEVFELKGSVFLRSTASSGVIIPDNAFTGDEDRATLLELAKRGIPQPVPV